MLSQFLIFQAAEVKTYLARAKLEFSVEFLADTKNEKF